MRLILTILTLFSVACGKAATAPMASEKLSPSGCVFDQTVINHDFLNWPSEDADKYTCDTLPKATCEYYESATERELRCETIDSNDPPAIPTTCSAYSAGMHLYLDGVLRPVTAYRCGTFQGNRCWLYASGGIREMRCYRQ